MQRTVARNGFRPQTWRFAWNAQNQMISAECPDGDVWHYAYDPFGRRISKHCSHTKVTFVWDGDVIAREVTEHRGQTQTVDWFFEPGSFRPMARLENGALSYVVNDHLGTPKEVVSEGGGLLWNADHDTWGSLRPLRKVERGAAEEDYWLTLSPESPTSPGELYDYPQSTFCPIRFQGQWEDAETGLYYNRFRYYCPFAKQYSAPDPIGVRGGPRTQAYVQTPISVIDPFGLFGSNQWTMNGSTLCLLDIFTPGTRDHGDFHGFMELWDEKARSTPGGLTRSPGAGEGRRSDAYRAWEKRIRSCCAGSMQPGDVIGHLPDVAWGGGLTPGDDGWVWMSETVNQYINPRNLVPHGTNYTAVKAVGNLADC